MSLLHPIAARVGRTTALLGLLVATGSLAADRYVSTVGSDTANDCLTSGSPCRTIGHSLSQAGSGDEIKLAQGKYQESSLSITTSLDLSGGWSGDFTTQDDNPAKTKIDAGLVGTVLTLTASSVALAVTLENLTISKGAAGGILATSDGTGTLDLTLDSCALKSNRTPGSGAGILALAHDTSSIGVTLTDSTLKGNRAGTPFVTGYGGGIFARALDSSAVDLALTRSVVKGNKSAVAGGGIAAWSSGGTLDLSLTDCTVKANKTQQAGAGGGVMVDAAIGATSVTIVNSAFKSNKGGDGGMFVRSTTVSAPVTLTLTNSTFTKNKAYIFGGGLRLNTNDVGSSLAATLTNVIVWGNIALLGSDDVYMSDLSGTLTVDVDHCDINDMTVDGTFNDLGGNINADPLLKGNLHLNVGSPAIDAGTCTGVPPTDIDGDVRPVGVTCDIGADEFVP